jgi:hypothetical protein
MAYCHFGGVPFILSVEPILTADLVSLIVDALQARLDSGLAALLPQGF